jgi:hypothetical protein
MRPVLMERLTSDVEAYRACLASMLQMDLDEFPAFEGLAASMQWNAWLASELNVCMLVFEFAAVPVPPGLWIARMPSPYQGYDVHSVVCAGTQPVHDPHPEAQPNGTYPNVTTMELMLPLDPGEPLGRFARQ